jgi:tetratricopeptide (TPR) repeat protein
MGESFLSNGDYNQAINCLKRCLEFYQESGNQDEESGVLNDLGAIFATLDDFDSSID